MARYIMANRRAGRFTESAKLASRATLANVLESSFMMGASILGENEAAEETGRHGVLFEAEPAEMAAKAATLPEDVIVEPEIMHYPGMYRPMDFLDLTREALDAPAVFGETTTMDVVVRSDGQPLFSAEVYLFLRGVGAQRRQLTSITDEQGQVSFEFSDVYAPSALVAVPAGGYWPMVLRGPSSPAVVDCPPLPAAEEHLGWWHHRLGIDQHSKRRGRGIRVGVIDTGVGPHPNLGHVRDVGAFVDGEHDPETGADVDSHGSHVCGIIGARPDDEGEFAGIAPGVQLFSARVFPPGKGANQLDITLAIDELSQVHGTDLINLSLGASVPSELEHDAILDAQERGCLCICAAGNSGGPVMFPAAFAETVAVSAVGMLGWGPAGSIAASRLPLNPELFADENLFLANFSCFGDEVVCTGPGVGYISTVPERFGLEKPYISMGGTSMASPAACAALAVVLSRSSAYKALPRNDARAFMALQLLRQSCQSIGLEAAYEGYGLPQT
jgi:subtilisin